MTDYTFSGEEQYYGSNPLFTLAKDDTLRAEESTSLGMFTPAAFAQLSSYNTVEIMDGAFIARFAADENDTQLTDLITATGGHNNLILGDIALLAAGGDAFDSQGEYNNIFIGQFSTISGGLDTISSGGHTIITNYGTIGTLTLNGNYAPRGYVEGIKLTGGNNTIDNKLPHDPNVYQTDIGIFGNTYAILIYNSNNNINNESLIASHQGQAIVLDGNGGNNTIQNSGLIITYAEKGASVIISSGNVADTITNTGDIIGNVELGAGNDSYFSSGLQDGTVYGGDGNDHIFVGQNPTRLEANYLSGGSGNDTLGGGKEADTFIFDANLGKSNVDTIIGFDPRNDTVQLSHYVFSSLKIGDLSADAFHIGSKAITADERILYNPDTGALSYDSDGSGSSAAIKFAVLTPHLTTLSSHDFFVA